MTDEKFLLLESKCKKLQQELEDLCEEYTQIEAKYYTTKKQHKKLLDCVLYCAGGLGIDQAKQTLEDIKKMGEI